MALDEVPAAWPHEEHRNLVVQPVVLVAGVELDRPVEGVGEVALAVDAVLPGRRVRILEVGHEDPGARVERVDHHLPVDRAGDLHPAVGDLVGIPSDAPVGRTDVGGLRKEVGQLTGLEAAEPRPSRLEELEPPRAELPLEVGQEGNRVGCENVDGLHPPILVHSSGGCTHTWVRRRRLQAPGATRGRSCTLRTSGDRCSAPSRSSR